MDAKTVIKTALDSSSMILMAYLEDFSDQELIMRPVTAAHHLAWQLGHLISSEHTCIKSLDSEQAAALDADFIARHDKENAASESPADFYTKAEYIEAYNQQRQATIKYLDSLSTEDLEKPGPEYMRAYAPTIGAALLMQATHVVMHTGQIAVLRRKLEKPIVI